MKMRSKTTLVLTVILSMWAGVCARAADFDNLVLANESYWNGSDGSGGFTSGSAFFKNTYEPTYSYWEGFAYSNLSQQTPPASGLAAQYAGLPGSGQATAIYAIGQTLAFYGLPTMTLDQPLELQGAYFTNNNYAYYSMLNGDGFAKKFGGATGADPDWFLLTIEGFDGQDDPTGTVEFYLADYRFADDSQDYIVPGWTWVDLSALGTVKKVTFSLSSSSVIRPGRYLANRPWWSAPLTAKLSKSSRWTTIHCCRVQF